MNRENTGLKDKNGVEIYEGDIVKIFGKVFEVKWDVFGWSFYQQEIHFGHLPHSDNGEIIGNIHENPELLK